MAPRTSPITTISVISEDSLVLDERVFFDKHDRDNSGKLSRSQLLTALCDLFASDGGNINTDHVERVIDEFDKDGDGEIDFCEYKTMVKYLKANRSPERSLGRKSRSVVMTDVLSELEQLDLNDNGDGGDDDSIILPQGIATMLEGAILRSHRDKTNMLMDISNKIYPYRDLLCVQDEVDVSPVDLVQYMNGLFDAKRDSMDQDFEAAFPPSSMRCLALVSHNEMKTTMREFVMANKNLLKKFRLTGTNSTMTMLKEVFKDEEKGTVLFGPACASGPLGGDAELVSLMVSGRIGGILFFRDPMSAHPHRADIDCLVRQALVHNTMMAETPTSALMMTHCLRQALRENKPEMIPSFFFSLQSPSVAAYKAQQKRVVEHQKEQARISLNVRPDSKSFGKAAGVVT